MARTIKKSLATATVNVAVITDSGEMVEKSFTLDGNPNESKALRVAQKKYGFNVMVLSVDIDESSVAIDPDVFFANSEVCNPDTSYGREYITQTFKNTIIHAMHMVDGSPKPETLVYFGVTTLRKARNFACDSLEDSNVIVTGTEVVEERRFMTREKYKELAR